MLQLLPNEFSYQQAEQLRSDLGLDTKGKLTDDSHLGVQRKYIGGKVEAGEQGVNAGNDKADKAITNYNYGNYSFCSQAMFSQNESK